MREFGVRPNRELGQNFLVDSNILDVIGRLAELRDDDVVLEVGGGLGVLSEYLAERVAHVHVVEIDRGLETALRDALDPHENTTLHLGDAVKLDLDALRPGAHEGRRQPALRGRGDRDPADDRAAVGRDVGGDGAEGGRRALRGRAVDAPPTACRPCSPSSRATCAWAARSRATCSSRCRTSTPCWSCCSATAGAARDAAPARPARLRPPPQGARPLAGALPGRRAGHPRPDPRALEAMGKPADARAETLGPADWRALWERLS